MPRSKAGVKRPKFDNEKFQRLKAAVEEVKKGMNLRTASRTYQVARSTLRRAVNNAEYNSYENCGVRKVFSINEELELVDYLQIASKMHYGLSRRELMKFAYDFAVANEKKTPEIWEKNKSAGKQWYYGFMKRHSNLSLRTPEATSLARATSFNKHNVSMFFDKLYSVMDKYHFSPDNIFNVDETANTTVHTTSEKLIACKGMKQVGSVTSGERGANITVIACVNALGNNIPPMFVFPRVNFKPLMLKGGSPNCVGTAHPSGWSNCQIFVLYLKHFIEYAKPSVTSPVLMIFDNHESHCSIEAVRLAKENGIILLTLPPHTSHKLQPLDCSVFGPYKTFYNTACREWMLAHPGVPISIYEVAELSGKAYPMAFNPVNIQSGFRVTGIWPLNRNIFTDDEFMPSSVTDRPPPPLPQISEVNSAPENSPAISTKSIDSPVAHVSPDMIRPYPHAAPRTTSNRGRKRGRCRILTDTPEKAELEQQAAMKAQMKARSMNRRLLSRDSSSSSDSSIPVILESEDELSDISVESVTNLASQISVGDFWLTSMMGKKSKHYYVAEVTGIDGVIEVKYLKRIDKTNKFLKNEDKIYETEKEDLILKLPRPITVGGSERRRQLLSFGVECFQGFNVE